MASSSSAQHIGTILMAVGLLIAFGALLFGAAHLSWIRRARMVGFGVLLISLNGLRVGTKIHDANIQWIAVFMIAISVLLMLFAHKLQR